ncbi:MAG: PEP-CTERM sorting domain-containing protein [Verrucomicrobiales bacterium]
MRITSVLSLFAALVAFPSLQNAHAQTVTWGNDLLSNTLLNSSGGFLDESFKFEIGTFADTTGGQPGTPYDPALEPYSSLQSFWKPIDFAVAPADAGWNTTTRTFAGSVNLTETAVGSNLAKTDGIPGSNDLFADPDLVPGGEQIYLWVHNGTLLSGGDATEAGLFTTDSWKMKNFEVLTFPVELNVSSLDQALYGQSLKNGLQTAVVSQSVPEPSVATLFLFAGVALLGRRRR